MSLHEIVLPETKPETEWVRGRALRKVSPTYSHARVQLLLATALAAWADAGQRGRIGTEWRFRVTPPGALTRPLVPDVAFLSYESVPRDAAPELVEVPLAAPTVAVEVLSPGDRPNDVADKIRTYLAAGSALVLLADPVAKTLVAHDAAGTRTYTKGDVFAHAALPGFTLDLGVLFAAL